MPYVSYTVKRLFFIINRFSNKNATEPLKFYGGRASKWLCKPGVGGSNPILGMEVYKIIISLGPGLITSLDLVPEGKAN